MPPSSGLERLLHLRSLEEEQCRAALESATGTQHRLRTALENALARERRGRESIAHSCASPADRMAGLVEHDSARRAAVLLRRHLAEAEARVAEARHLYLEKRTERRQVETIIREAQARQALLDARRDQQQLDQSFGDRLHRTQRDRGQTPRPPATDPEIKNRKASGAIPEEEHRSNR